MNKLYQLSFGSKINFLFKSLLVVTAIIAGVSSKVKAQVSAYSFSQSAGAYSPVCGTVLGTATGNASATNLNSVIYPVHCLLDLILMAQFIQRLMFLRTDLSPSGLWRRRLLMFLQFLARYYTMAQFQHGEET